MLGMLKALLRSIEAGLQAESSYDDSIRNRSLFPQVMVCFACMHAIKAQQGQLSRHKLRAAVCDIAGLSHPELSRGNLYSHLACD